MSDVKKEKTDKELEKIKLLESPKDKSKYFKKMLLRLLGGLPVTAGIPSEKDKLIRHKFQL